MNRSQRVESLDTPRVDYARFFAPGGFPRLWRNGHPYEHRELYELIDAVWDYDAHYVNYGYWPDGIDSVEPGRQMSLLVGEALGLSKGDRLIDAGSGLGQAAVDLALSYELDRVVGINPCRPQVQFANALADAAGLREVVQHHVGDASTYVRRLVDDGFTHAMAIECINHFPDGLGFLQDVRDALPPGGRVAFPVAVSNRRQTRWQKAAIGFMMSVDQKPGDFWTDQLERAGLVPVERTDITEEVVRPVIAYTRRRLSERPDLLRQRTGPLSRVAIRAFMAAAERGLDNGTMGYELIVGEVPGA